MWWFFVFFFKQKTAYEIYKCDWSSDVCSSDLIKNGRDPYVMVRAPASFPGRKYNGLYCYEHTLVWWKNNGSVPASGYVLHHTNEDVEDNRIENLELKSRSVHSSDHGYLRKRPTVHGSSTAYRHHKCRCDKCVKAQNERHNKYRWRTGRRKKRNSSPVAQW